MQTTMEGFARRICTTSQENEGGRTERMEVFSTNGICSSLHPKAKRVRPFSCNTVTRSTKKETFVVVLTLFKVNVLLLALACAHMVLSSNIVSVCTYVECTTILSRYLSPVSAVLKCSYCYYVVGLLYKTL